MKNKNTKLDRSVYWVCQIILSVLAGAGVWHYLQPVDPILAIPLTIVLVANLFYVSLKNR